MDKKIILILILFLLVSCIPQVIKQNGKNYQIIDWEGGNFIYLTYNWKGGKFDDALELIKKLDEIKKSRGLDELALARFPSGKEWHIGFIAKAPFIIDTINGYKIEQVNLPAGKYASLKTKGYPENLYIYWPRFKEWLIKDGLKIESPVFEIYKNETFDPKIPSPKRNGELRYKINQ